MVAGELSKQAYLAEAVPAAPADNVRPDQLENADVVEPREKRWSVVENK